VRSGTEWGEVEDLARTLGLHKLVSLTPARFMAPEEMPTEESVEACCAAIHRRNGIIHAKRTRDGLYRSPLSVDEGLGKHINAALLVYEHHRRPISQAEAPIVE